MISDAAISLVSRVFCSALLALSVCVDGRALALAAALALARGRGAPPFAVAVAMRSTRPTSHFERIGQRRRLGLAHLAGRERLPEG